MELFDKFYRRLGFNRPTHFHNPPVFKNTTFSFPLYSEVYNVKLSEVAEDISKTGIFSNSKKIFVKTILEYSGETEGRFIAPPFNQNVFISDLAKRNPNIKYLRNTGQTSLTITRDTLFIYNYGCLNQRYDYIKNDYVDLWKFNNLLHTVVADINKNRHNNVFLTIYLPDRMPLLRILNEWSNNLSLSRLKKISSYKFLTLLELWKFITPSLKEKSIFNQIKPEFRGKINLLFITELGVSVNCLGLIEKMIKEYNVDSKEVTSSESFNKIKDEDLLNLNGLNLSFEDAMLRGEFSFKAETFKKLFYIYINNIIASVTKGDKSILDVSKFSNSDSVINLGDTYTPELKEEEIIDNKNLDRDLENQIDSMGPNDNGQSDNLFGEEVNVEAALEAENEEETDDGTAASAVLEETQSYDEKEYDSVDNIIEDVEPDPKSKIDKNVDILKDNGLLSSNTAKSIKEKVANKDQIKIDLVNEGKTVSATEILNTPTKLPLENLKIEDNPSVLDESYNNNIIKTLDEQYIKEEYERDIVKTLFSLEKSLVVVESIEQEVNPGSDDLMTYTVKVKPLNGQPSTLRFVLPTPKEDGTFRINENTYRMRKQRQQIPIYKSGPTQVSLNSYYGKLFVNKALKKSQTYSYWLLRVLLANKSVTNITPGDFNKMNTNLHKLYTKIARGIKFFDYTTVNEDNKSVRVLRFSFDYDNRHGFIQDVNDDMLMRLESNGLIIAGQSLTKMERVAEPIVEVILLDANGDIYLSTTDGKKRQIDNFYSMIGKEPHEGPIEFASLKVLKENVPIVYLLCYYFGLNNLLKALKTKYLVLDSKSKKNLEGFPKDHYIVKFNNKYLVLERDYGIADMILGGLLCYRQIEKINFETFLNKKSFLSVFSLIDLPGFYIKEIKIMEDMFIDPITKEILEQMKLPLTFRGLLVQACKMLLDDNYEDPSDVKFQLVKGYERVSGLLYKSIVESVRQHDNRTAFARSKLIGDPYGVLSKIKDDSTTILENDINPLSIIKSQTEVSWLGAGGRSIETMTKESRVRKTSELGFLSESVKDDGNVSVISTLSSATKIDNIRGMIDTSGELSWGSILSPGSLLAPFATQDDGKRINFISIQSGHLIPINDMRVPRIRTGYESIIPVLSPDKYAVTAKQEGVVLKVDKKNMKVKYKNGDEATYKIYKWTTKEESSACYEHELVPNFKQGDSFKKDDTLLYDSVFFEPDIFNPSRVLYKQGTDCNVAIVENTETYEDSASISSKLAERTGTNVMKVHSIVLDASDELFNVLPIGTKVEHTSVMFSFMSQEAGDLIGLDERTIEILKDLKSSSPKAKVRGEIANYIVRYNCEFDELSKGLQSLVKESDARLLHAQGFNGRITGNYSVKGKPILPGEVEIKVYIKVNEGMGIGDKAVFGNQLKFTVGEVYENSIKTEETGEDVEAFFGFISIQARIVNSPFLIGTTNTVLEKIQEKMIEVYFGKQK